MEPMLCLKCQVRDPKGSNRRGENMSKQRYGFNTEFKYMWEGFTFIGIAEILTRMNRHKGRKAFSMLISVISMRVESQQPQIYIRSMYIC